MTDSPWPRHELAHRRLQQQIQALAQDTGPSLRRYARSEIVAASLRRHARYEETEVLPRYAELCPSPVPNGRPATVYRDHQLLFRRAERLTELALHRLALPVPSLRLAEALDQLRATLEHHDQREHRYVYRGLRDTLEDSEIAALDDALPALASAAHAGRAAAQTSTDPLVVWVVQAYQCGGPSGDAPTRSSCLEQASQHAVLLLVDKAARHGVWRGADSGTAWQASMRGLSADRAWRAAVRLVVRQAIAVRVAAEEPHSEGC